MILQRAKTATCRLEANLQVRQKCRHFLCDVKLQRAFNKSCNCRLWGPNKKQIQQVDFLGPGRERGSKKSGKESRDGAVCVALTSGNLGRADDRAKCSGGSQTGLETAAVQRWSWQEKQTFCSVWESMCVGKLAGSGPSFCLRAEDDSVFFSLRL